jgi:hypothetical protein
VGLVFKKERQMTTKARVDGIGENGGVPFGVGRITQLSIPDEWPELSSYTEEGWRLRRLIAVSVILEIDLQEVGGIGVIRSLHDHKGTLEVHTKFGFSPGVEFKESILKAWEALNEPVISVNGEDYG